MLIIMQTYISVNEYGRGTVDAGYFKKRRLTGQN